MEIIFVRLVTVLCVIFHTCSASVPCCKGENILNDKKCSDGSRVVNLPCELKYMTGPRIDLDISVDEYDNLILPHGIVSSDKYCATKKLNGSEQIVTYLVCFEDTETTAEQNVFITHAVLELISVCFIVITIIIYLQVPDLLDLQGICTLHSISGLAVSFLALGVNQLTTTRMQDTLCLFFAYIIYFAMLYAFFWLNILAFHIWRIITKPKLLSSIKQWAKIYHLFGIGGPIILLALLLIAHHSSALQFSELHPGLGEIRCWFKSMKSQFVYFYCPMGFLIGLNIIYYTWTITILWKQLADVTEKNIKVLKYKLVLCVKLFIIMGITWIFEILSAAFEDAHYILNIFWIITDCLNTLQGILIFLILVVFRKKVIRGLANRSFCGTRLPNRWRTLADDECEDIEEEFGLSETQVQKQ